MKKATTALPHRTHVATRDELHRIAAHVLARRRFDVSGRFGLRASPGGFATPAFGEGPETIRMSGTTLVREVAGTSTHVSIVGSTLRDLADSVGVNLDSEFSCGEDTPPIGDRTLPVDLDADVVGAIADWYDLGWRVLDAVVAELPAGAAPVTIQLWPEHFDAGTNVGVASGERANLGFSPGDMFDPEPYAYVGPWGSHRPGDPTFWNAPFGAVLRRAEAARHRSRPSCAANSCGRASATSRVSERSSSVSHATHPDELFLEPVAEA